MADLSQPPTAMKILRQSTKLCAKSWRIMLTILLCILPPLYLINFVFDFSLTPITTDKTTKFYKIQALDPKNPEYHKVMILFLSIADIMKVLGIEKAAATCSYMLIFVVFISTVYGTAMAYHANEITCCKSVIAKIKENWKGPLVTHIFVGFLSFVFLTCWVTLVVLFAVVSSVSVAFFAMSVLSAVAGVLLLVYLDIIWTLGLVSSILEKGCCGFVALRRGATALSGRKELGWRVYLCWLAAVSIVSVLFTVVDWLVAGRKALVLGSGILMLTANVAMAMSKYVAFSVFCLKLGGRDGMGLSSVAPPLALATGHLSRSKSNQINVTPISRRSHSTLMARAASDASTDAVHGTDANRL